MNDEIELTQMEIFTAASAGVRRRMSAIRHGRIQPYGDPGENVWDIDIESAAAEMSVARAVDAFWTPVVRKPEELEGDCGAYQVRSTWRSNGRLIIHDEDLDDAVFIFVTGRIPTFTICGWMFGWEAKDIRFWKEDAPRPAFFVPQDALSKMDDLPREKRGG